MQIVSNPTRFAAVHLAAERVRLEYVVVVEGTVQPRPDEMVNPNMPTGEVEVSISTDCIVSGEYQKGLYRLFMLDSLFWRAQAFQNSC